MNGSKLFRIFMEVLMQRPVVSYQSRLACHLATRSDRILASNQENEFQNRSLNNVCNEIDLACGCGNCLYGRCFSVRHVLRGGPDADALAGGATCDRPSIAAGAIHS